MSQVKLSPRDKFKTEVMQTISQGMNEYQAVKALGCSRAKYAKALDSLRESGELREHMRSLYENTIIRVMSVRHMVVQRAQKIANDPNKHNIFLSYMKQALSCDEVIMRAGHFMGFQTEDPWARRDKKYTPLDHATQGAREILDAHFEQLKTIGP